jgi:hypothetical protein
MNYIVYYRTREAFRDAMFTTPDNVVKKDYEKVACVQASDLEDLFRRMNCVDGSDIEYVGRGKLEIRSLSVGDIAVSDEGAYLCASCGWEKVEGLTW